VILASGTGVIAVMRPAQSGTVTWPDGQSGSRSPWGLQHLYSVLRHRSPASSCGLPVRPFLAASTTCRGGALPFRLAEILGARSGLALLAQPLRQPLQPAHPLPHVFDRAVAGHRGIAYNSTTAETSVASESGRRIGWETSTTTPCPFPLTT